MTPDTPRIARADFPNWHFPLPRPQTGIPLGNSRVGLLVWGEGRTLRLTIGLADLWDHRGGAEWHDGQTYGAIRAALEAKDAEALKKIFPPTPMTPQVLPLGRVEISLPEGLVLDLGRLDVRRGAMEVRTRAEKRRGVAAKGAGVPILKIVLDRETGAVAVAWPAGFAPESVRAVPAWENELARAGLEARAIEPPALAPEGDGFSQRLPADPAVALAFVRSARGICACTGRGGNPASITAGLRALDAARTAAAAAAGVGFAVLAARTAQAWRDYWDRSARIDVPNATLQNAWELGMFKFGASTAEPGEPQCVPCPLQGPWLEDTRIPPWGADYHFNINVQECYWPAFAGAPIERLRPLLDMVVRWLPRLRRNAEAFTGLDDGIMLSHAVDDTGKAMDAGFWTGMMDHGATMWMADFFWRYVERGGGDRKFLAKAALPFMKGAFNVLWAMLERTPDGSLSLPVGPSPEFRGAALDAWGRDPSFQLAAAHRLAENLLAAAARLHEDPDPRWRELLEKLPSAALVDVGGKKHIALWQGLDLPETHRHHSHLAGLFPFDTIDPDDPEWTETVDHSFRNWMWRGCALWTGWCTTWASILHSRVGNGDMAELLLEIWDRAFVNEGRGTLHDTCISGISLYGMGGLQRTSPYPPPGKAEIMQLDASGAAATAVMEMLLMEKRGAIHLFRGAPARWLDVSFARLRGPGGVRVSAARRNGVVSQVEFEAEAGTANVTLANPWPDAPAATLTLENADREPRRLKAGETYSFRLPAGAHATLRAADA